jgi:8-oxo-dGTP diphosphatase
VLELDETIHAGLRREVREETGLDVEPEALSGIYKNMRHGIIALVFRCRIVGGAPCATNEVQEVAWLTPDEVRDKMDEAYATRLLDALTPGPAAIRAHDGRSLLSDQDGQRPDDLPRQDPGKGGEPPRQDPSKGT